MHRGVVTSLEQLAWSSGAGAGADVAAFVDLLTMPSFAASMTRWDEPAGVGPGTHVSRRGVVAATRRRPRPARAFAGGRGSPTTPEHSRAKGTAVAVPGAGAVLLCNGAPLRWMPCRLPEDGDSLQPAGMAISHETSTDCTMLQAFEPTDRFTVGRATSALPAGRMAESSVLVKPAARSLRRGRRG